jgi:hypothetical protein
LEPQQETVEQTESEEAPTSPSADEHINDW